ncbi:PilN domain-containing protein [Lichenibacterium ramalinae]|uniref:PilN domain-containing protein n=1 Tax=Lichenibacterium ramalinae TaxID=2316527 RepID=A0A4V1RII7_9HYPH|nr:PilN domain-containing protein [Lichenibacterium ramalinae]RYB04092.1 hypothetical protein D3272_13765 [Lichenibacterium ramalinae]
MSGHASPAPSRPGSGPQAVAARWHAAAAWWRAGARASLPARWAAAWGGRSRPIFVLSRAGGAWACLRVAGTGVTPLDFGPAGFTLAGLAAWLAAQGLARDDIRLAVALPRDEVLLRTLTLPESALPRLDALLEQEVLRRTPFAPEEIWHGGEVLPGSGPVRTVRHWIARRDFVRRALDSLGLEEAAVDAVAVEADGAAPVAVVPLRDGGTGTAHPDPAPLLKAAGAVALLVTALALAGADGVEGLRAARASDALAAARHDAEPGRRNVGALLAMKAVPGLGAAWAELSRIVPDDTYVTELRLDDGAFAMRGISGSAVRLLRTVDASPLFTAAALSGGIEPNGAGGLDQFALSFDLRARPPRARRPAAAAAR